jgi:hypothetical protein
MNGITGSVLTADIDSYTVTQKLPFYTSLLRTVVTRSLVVSARGDEKAGCKEGRHCSRTAKRFLPVLKMSTVTEATNALPAQ